MVATQLTYNDTTLNIYIKFKINNMIKIIILFLNIQHFEAKNKYFLFKTPKLKKIIDL